MSRGIDLSVFLKLAGDLTKPLKGAEDKIKDSTDRMKKSMSLSLKMAGSGAVATGIKVATDGIINNFTASYKEVQKASGDLRSLGMKDMQAVIKEGQRLQNTYVGLTTEAFVRAAYDIKSGVSSLTDEGVAAMTASALTVAKATKGVPENMTSLFATSYGIFKKQFSEMSDADWGDMFGAALSKSVQQFKTDGAKMQQAIESAGAGATNLGMKMTEQMTLLGMMQQQMQAGEAGTALKAFAANSAKAHAAFEKLAKTSKNKVRVNILDEKGQLRQMPDILSDLKERYGETLDAFEAAEIAKAFGTEEAMKLINALYGQEEAVKANADALAEAAQQGAEFTEAMAANVDAYDGAGWDLFQQKLATIKEQIGAGLLPALDKLAPVFASIAGALGGFIERNPELVAGIGGVVVGLSGIATVAAPVLFAASSLTAMLGSLGGAFGVVSVAVAALSRVLLANPIGVAVTAIAGGAYLIWKHWEPIKAFFMRLWESVKSFTSNAWEGIKSTFLNYTPHGLIIKHWDTLSDWFAGLWSRVKGATSRAWEGIKNTFLNYTPAGLVMKHWDGLSQKFGKLWGNVKTGMTGAWDGIKSAFLNYTPHGLIYTHWDDIAGWFGRLWDRVKSTFTTKWDEIKNALNISDWFDFAWADVLPDWDWSAIIPSLPDFKSMFTDANEAIDVRLENRASNSLGREWQEGVDWINQYRQGLIGIEEIKARLQSKIAKDGGTVFDGFEVNRAQDMLALLQDIEAAKTSAMPQIQSPESLMEAAQVAETLTQQFPALSLAAQETQTAVTASLSQTLAEVRACDLTSEGARIMQSLAEGIRSQVAAVSAAAGEITQAIQTALPKSASLKIGVSGGGSKVQERARGGSYGPGWLLTGENGPELRYANESGFIAHNRALRGMMNMAERTRDMVRNLGFGNLLAGGVASAGMGAMSAAASPMGGMDAFQQVAGKMSGGKTVTVHHSPVYQLPQMNGDGDLEQRIRAILDVYSNEQRLDLERYLND